MRKAVVFLGVALAAMIAVAPSSAQANWTHLGEELEGEPTISLTGSMQFNTEAAGFHFNTSVKLKLTGGSNTGHVSDFTVTNCTGTGALLNRPCTATPTGTWLAHAEPANNRINITNVTFVNHYYADAGHTIKIGESSLTGDITATVNNKGAITSVTGLVGDGTVMGGLPMTVSGSLTVSAPDAGTYGFE